MLPVCQVLTKEKEQRTEKMMKKANKQEFKDTEKMVQWRSINQERN